MLRRPDGKNQGQRNRSEYALGERGYGFPDRLIVKDARITQVNMQCGNSVAFCFLIYIQTNILIIFQQSCNFKYLDFSCSTDTFH